MVTIDERATTGVSFALNEEQKELRRLARDFAAKEIRPLEHECGRGHREDGGVEGRAAYEAKSLCEK